MKKSEFKKILRQEKNPILTDRRILYVISIIYIINILFMVVNMGNLENDITIVEESLGFIVGGGTLIFVIPAIIIDTAIDIKINKMYKKHLAGEDYKNSVKRIKKPIIIISLILGIIGALILLDFSYCEFTSNRPILSIKDTKEEREHIEKYKAFLYDYYKCDDGRKYLKSQHSEFIDPYYINIGGEDILLERTEIIKDKVYIGIPNKFTKASEEHINTRYNLSNMVEYEAKEIYQYKDGKINFISAITDNHVENNEIEDALDALIYGFDTYMSDYITWEEQIIQTIGEDRKVGIISFYMDIPQIEYGKYYCCMWIYSVDGQYVINSFDVDSEYMEEWKGLGMRIEDTLEFAE